MLICVFVSLAAFVSQVDDESCVLVHSAISEVRALTRLNICMRSVLPKANSYFARARARAKYELPLRAMQERNSNNGGRHERR